MPSVLQGTEEARNFSSPHEEALLTLMRSADCLHRSLQQRLKPHGVTATQYNVLRILRGARPNGLTCSAIGNRLITPEPDITRLVGRLKLQKLVQQQRDKDDKRIHWTHITDEGLKLLSGLDGIIDRTPRELLQRLNLEEVKTLTRLLNKAQCCSSDQDINNDSIKEKLPVTGKPPSPYSRPKLLLPHHRPE